MNGFEKKNPELTVLARQKLNLEKIKKSLK